MITKMEDSDENPLTVCASPYCVGPNPNSQRVLFQTITFSILWSSRASYIFFFKNALDVSGFHNPEWCFPLLNGKKMSYEFFRIL